MSSPADADTKCRAVNHHLRNSMQVIMAKLHILEHTLQLAGNDEIQAIYAQIDRMVAALAGCATPTEMETTL
jgi:hypothetical protein